jgi:hypothetical protein
VQEGLRAARRASRDTAARHAGQRSHRPGFYKVGHGPGGGSTGGWCILETRRDGNLPGSGKGLVSIQAPAWAQDFGEPADPIKPGWRWPQKNGFVPP